jgi:hypothetical protein
MELIIFLEKILRELVKMPIQKILSDIKGNFYKLKKIQSRFLIHLLIVKKQMENCLLLRIVHPLANIYKIQLLILSLDIIEIGKKVLW